MKEVLEDAGADIWNDESALLSNAFIGSPTEMWSMRHALSEGVKEGGKRYAFDLLFRRQDLMPFCDRMQKELGRLIPAAKVCDFGHVGDGGVHFNLVLPSDTPEVVDPAFECGLRDIVYAVAVKEFGGSFSAEHAIGRRNQHYYYQFTSEPLKRMARDLKTMLGTGRLGTPRFG